MKKFQEYLKENEEYNNQLKMGITVEAEHLDVYNYFKKFIEDNGLKMPIPKEKLFEMIAKSHLKEFGVYYTALTKMEKKLKGEN